MEWKWVELGEELWEELEGSKDVCEKEIDLIKYSREYAKETKQVGE